MADRLTEGEYDLALTCPRCAREVLVILNLGAVLTVPSSDVPTVKVKASSKPVLHRCEQFGLFDDDERLTVTMQEAPTRRRGRKPAEP